MSCNSSGGSAADRNLLFGILALQMDFIGRDALIAGMHAWVLDKTKSLGQILVEQRVLQPGKCELLKALVQAHLEQHSNQVENSLAAIRPAGPLRRELEKLADPDMQASLLLLTDDPATPAEPLTTDYSAGSAGVTLHYEILRPHARGGLGEVFVARDRQLGREVALKEIQSEHARHPNHRSRFLREAEITGRLEHPGVVPVYGLGQYADGRPFYAMRFIRGDSLKDAIRAFHGTEGESAMSHTGAARNLEFRQLLGRFVDVCNAVAYAHSRGVLHRDLKPGNIMLGKYGETLIVDWGLARSLERAESDTVLSVPAVDEDSAAGLTQAGTVLGTPGYMSPEQAGGRLEELGPASDVYSLGATLYTLLTGRPAFTSNDTGSILDRVQKGDFPPPRQVRREVPAALEAVCLKAMALRPAARYATPKTLAEDIEHWLADEPVSAWREPLSVRGRRWMKRHRVLVMASMTALLVGALTLGVATVLLSAKNDELHRANEAEAEAFRQAQANFEMANQAVEDYLFNVADDDRLKERDLAELRKKLVASAATFYQRFIAASQDNPRLEFMLGRAYYNLGHLHSELTELNDAIAKLEQAKAIFGRLTEADTENPEYQYYLGLAGLDLEQIYRFSQKRFDQAEKEWEQMMPLFEKLARHHPTVKSYRSKESECVLRRSNLLNLQGHPDQAEPLCRRSIDLHRQIVKDFPDTEEQHVLCDALSMLGNLLNSLNRRTEARQVLEEAIQINRAVVLAAPRTPRYRVESASIYRELMWNLRGSREPKHAEQAIRKALEVDRQLVAEFPGVPSHQANLVEDLRFLTEELTNTGASQEAVPLGREAIRVGDKLVADYPKDLSFRRNLGDAYYALARALHRHGELAEGETFRRRSIDVFQALCQDHPEVPRHWEGLGTGHSGLAFVLAQTKRFAEAKEEGFQALAVFEKLVRDYPSAADYPFRVAQTCLNLAGDLAHLGEPNQEVINKGIAAVEALLPKGKNVQHQSIYAALKELPVVPAGPLDPAGDVTDAPATVEGKLTEDDPLDKAFSLTKNSHHKVHLIAMKAGKHYQIDLTGDLDTLLRLEDLKQKRLLFNDDVTPPDNLNSRVVFSCMVTATFRVIATTVKPGFTGPYTLKVQEAVAAGPPQVIAGKLTEGDENVKGKYAQRHNVKLQAGLAHVIEAKSTDFDTRMVMTDAAGKQGSKAILITRKQKQTSRIDFTPAQTGAYTLFLTTAQPGQTGAYTIQVQAYKLAGP
jgi:serine/threonine-protein kinase